MVRERAKNLEDERKVIAEETRLRRKIARVCERRIPGPPMPTLLWFGTLTATYFLFEAAFGSDRAIPKLLLVFVYIAETVSIAWWSIAAEEPADTRRLERKLLETRLRRGCGSPSCRRCYLKP